jgi:hypothetical protein
VQPLPDYTRRKPLAGGQWGFYFEPPSWARKPADNDDRGPCPVGAEQLGTDYAAAVRRVENVLLPQFDSWRTRALIDLTPALLEGTLDWLFKQYRYTDNYKKLSRKQRKLHDAGFKLVGDYLLKDGQRFGDVLLASIDGGIVDLLYEKLLPMRDGQGQQLPLFRDGLPVVTKSGEPVLRERRVVVNHAMKSCRRAWNIGIRRYAAIVPAANPFARMGLVAAEGKVEAANWKELEAAVIQADAMGLFSLGTAMMLTWEWLQREEHIFTAFELAHYRPRKRPNHVYIVHPKNGEAVWIPLFDAVGVPQFPELMARMDALKRDRVGGGPFFMRDWIDQKAGVRLPWVTASGLLNTMSKKVKAVIKAAGLDEALTFTSFRHGGLTECGDAELTDTETRAVSRHKSSQVLPRYIKRTEKQIIHATQKRRATRPKIAAGASNQLDLFDKSSGG